MFATVYQRFLWKECRATAPLWIACLCMGVLLQLSVIAYAVYHAAGGSIANHAQGLYVISLFFSTIYSVGCAVMLFSAERDERTSEWLVILAPPPSAVLASKFTFAIGSIVLLQVILAFAALLTGAPTARFTLEPFVPLLVLIWALLGSLCSRYGLVSIPLMVLGFVLTYMLPVAIYHRAVEWWVGAGGLVTGSNWTSSALLFDSSLVLLVVAADVWIGWRWCRGKYLDFSLLEPASAACSAWLSARWPWSLRAGRLPVGLEQGEAWRRVWQRLLWQERHRERAHLLILAVGLGLALVLSLNNHLNRNAYMMAPLLYVLAIPLAMGLLAFRSDTSGQQQRFLQQHGIAPGAVWLAKQWVWFPRAVVISALIFCWSWLCEWLSVNPQLDHLLDQNLRLIRENPAIAVVPILAGYCSGQLGGCLFRRFPLAILAGLLFNGVLMMAYQMATSLLLPQWLFVGMPIAMTLAMSLWQTSAWLNLDESRQRIARLGGMFVAMPLILFVSIAGYRAYEIRPAEIGKQTLIAWQDTLRKVSAPIVPADERLAIEMVSLSQPALAEQDAAADQIVDLLNRTITTLKFSPARSADEHYYAAIKQLLERRTESYTQSGDLERAADCLLADLKLSRLIAHHSPLRVWQMATARQQATLNTLVELANDSRQRVESITALAVRVEHELAQFPPIGESIAASYREDQHDFVDASAADVVSVIARDQESVPYFATWVVRFIRERWRLSALIRRESMQAYERAAVLESQLSGLGQSRTFDEADIESAAESETARWNSTTVLARLTTRPLHDTTPSLYQRQTINRAARTRLAILVYRKTHQSSPDQLLDLTQSVVTLNLVDPFSNRLFEYYPAFLLSEGQYGVTLRPDSPTTVTFTHSNRLTSTVQLPLDRLKSHDVTAIQAVIDQLVRSSLTQQNVFPIPPAHASPASAVNPQN